MIENEGQYKTTKEAARQFEDALSALAARKHQDARQDALNEIQRRAFASQLSELKDELSQYELLHPEMEHGKVIGCGGQA